MYRESILRSRSIQQSCRHIFLNPRPKARIQQMVTCDVRATDGPTDDREKTDQEDQRDLSVVSTATMALLPALPLPAKEDQMEHEPLQSHGVVHQRLASRGRHGCVRQRRRRRCVGRSLPDPWGDLQCRHPGGEAATHNSEDSPNIKSSNKPSHHTVHSRADAAVNGW